MKRIGLLFLVLSISLILVACGSKEETVTLEGEENGAVSTITYKAEGDKVTEQSTKNELPYEVMGVSNAEEAEALLADTVAGFEGIEGLTYEMDYQDDVAVEQLTVDYEKADMDEISNLMGSSFEGDVSEGISLKNSVEMLKEQGFEEVE